MALSTPVLVALLLLAGIPLADFEVCRRWLMCVKIHNYALHNQTFTVYLHKSGKVRFWTTFLVVVVVVVVREVAKTT